MATSYSPKIPTTGLILALDAGNRKCFIPGQTSCVNLVTGGAVTGANGTPGAGTHTPNTANFPAYSSVAGGVFNFAGGKGMNCDENLGYSTTRTLSMWTYKGSSSTEYYTDARNDGGTWFLSNYTSQNINYTEALTYNFNGSYNESNTNFINKWLHIVVTSDNTDSKIYINGTLATGGSRSSIDEDFGVNFRIGTRYTTSGQWTGYMGPILAYNIVLSAETIAQMYQSSKSRFGL